MFDRIQQMDSRITINPGICGGRPTVRGMRITVADVLQLLAGGMTRQEVLDDYPYLEAQDVQACLEYASRLASHHSAVRAEASGG